MHRRKRTQFWGKDKNDDYLIRQIIAGEKTATCCPAKFFNEPEGSFHDGGFEIDDIVEVYDLNGIMRCLIRINAIYETTLGDPPEELWKGECCSDASEFVAEHFACWKELNVSEATKITATHFQLVETVNAP